MELPYRPSLAGHDKADRSADMPAAHDLDEVRLARWMQDEVADFAGPLSVSRFSGGQSNPTYRLDTPARSYVLRRKPFGHLLPGAHAIEREYRVASALNTVGFPVPRVYVLCEDTSVIGASFYIMDIVVGRVFWNPRFLEVERDERATYLDAMNATLARLHSIDYVAIGLADYGRSGNYVARQVSRWSRQYLEDREAGRNSDMDRLIEWLPLHVPTEDETTLVHGDYRCDNMIFHPTQPKLIAVLDWELSTLGHPLADFTYHAMMYRLPPTIMAGLKGADLRELGLPSEESFLAAYCARTGRTLIPAYTYFIAFNMFRFAAILHGIKGRALRGSASSPEALAMASHIDELAALAWEEARKGG